MCLYLSRHDEDALDDGHVAPQPQTKPIGEGEVVLVVDDEPTIRMLVSEILSDSGYCVIGAPNGPTGLRLLGSNARIDLLITDIGLPGGMNGRQVADAAPVSRPDLKVLFITGYARTRSSARVV